MHKALSLLCFAATLSFAGGKAFLDIPLEQALKRAEVEQKLVFIDFYTDWCAPCKFMARTTFQDEKVLDWLHKHAIALAINAEAQADIAEKYKIRAYPTLVFLKADGEVIRQVTGYRDATRFLAECEALATGSDPDAEEEAKRANTDSINSRLSQARQLVLADKKDEACELLKGLLAELKGDSLRETLRSNSIYRGLQRCQTAEANAVLRAEYVRIYDAIRAGQINTGNIRQFGTLTRMTHGKTLLELYDELKQAGAADSVLALFSGPVFDEMLDAKRYEEIEQLESIEHRLAELDQKIERLKKQPVDRQMFLGDFLIRGKAQVYHLLLGLGRVAEAQQLADAIVLQSQSASTYSGLAAAAYATHHYDLSLSWSEKAHQIAGNSDVDVLETYVHALAANGRKDQALSLIKSAIASKPENGRERRQLDSLLKELSRPGPG